MVRVVAFLFAVWMTLPIGAQQLVWPESAGAEQPGGLDLVLEAGPNAQPFGFPPIFFLGRNLPDSSGSRAVYSYGRGVYGVLDFGSDLELGEDVRHSLFDGHDHRQLGHGELLPIRPDELSPRIYDVRYLHRGQWTSIVTWRNNLVPVGELVLEIRVGDLPTDGSGVAEVALRHGQALVSAIFPGIRRETTQGDLAAELRGPSRFALVPSASPSQIWLRGTLPHEPGRSLLQIEVRDYAGNFVQLNFVLIRSDEL